MESETAAYTYRHIRIPGEIKIYLECEGQYPYPRAAGRQRSKPVGKETVGNLGELVGEDDLLSKSYQETERAVIDVVGGGVA